MPARSASPTWPTSATIRPASSMPGRGSWASTRPPAAPSAASASRSGRPGRAEELVECERHEALLNLAFAGAPAWQLVCPYDTETLPPAVIEEACRNHPVLDDGARRVSPAYREAAVIPAFDEPLPDPPVRPREFPFVAGDTLEPLRRFVGHQADGFGLPPSRRNDLVFSANEVATNSLVHGGGRGLLRMWPTGRALVCEIRDHGVIDDPLVGRERPSLEDTSGLGLWLAHQLGELAHVPSRPQ